MSRTPSAGNEKTALVPADGPALDRPEVQTSADLDAAVAICRAAERKGAEGVVALAKELKRIRDTKLYVLQLDPETKAPVYKFWKTFVEWKLRIPKGTADRYIRTLDEMGEEAILELGMTRAAIVASVPPTEQRKFLALLEAGASTREVQAAAQKVKAETKFQLPAKSGKKMPQHAGKAKPKPETASPAPPTLSVEQIGETFGIEIAPEPTTPTPANEPSNVEKPATLDTVPAPVRARIRAVVDRLLVWNTRETILAALLDVVREQEKAIEDLAKKGQVAR